MDEVDLSLDLVRRINAGDRDAWDALYLRYRDALLFSVRARLGANLRTRLESEDILHSVVKDAIADLRDFAPDRPDALLHYLHVCVLNKIRAKAVYHGAQKRSGAVALSDDLLERLPAHGEPTYLDAERYERLERGLGTLPEAMRDVILLRRIEGLSNRAAADVLGKTPEATSKLFNRAIARLAVATGAEGDGRAR